MKLDKQKLEYTDFSGGITENDLPGRPNVYLSADNFLITRDKQLESRPGSDIYGSTSYQLPTAGYRVLSLIPFNNDAELFSVGLTQFFYLNGSSIWTNLLGPSGNAAFVGNTNSSKVAHAEWKKQLFLTTDGGGLPQKVYRDQSGVLQLRQAGLPLPTYSSQYTTAALLSAAITLAVDLRNSMLAHVNDYGAINTSKAHLVQHASVATALTALTTPVTASDLATYVGVLKTQYTAHITDAQITSFTQVYHINVALAFGSSPGFLGRYPVLNLSLNSSLPAPTDLASSVNVLNDLRNKYNWHTYATATHGNAINALVGADAGVTSTDTTGFGKNKVATAIVAQDSGPIFSGNFSTLFDFLNNIKTEYNTHLVGITNHSNNDADNTIIAPNATDLFSAVTLLAHLEFFYWWHYKDSVYLGEFSASSNFTSFTANTTLGSATMATSSINGSSYVGGYILNLSNGGAGTSFFPSTWFASTPAKVTGGTATTVVLDKTFNSTTSGYTWYVTTSKYHFGKDSASASQTSPVAYRDRLALLDYTVPTLSGSQTTAVHTSGIQALITEATTLIGLIKGHQLSGMTYSTTPYPGYYNAASGNFAHYGQGLNWPVNPVSVAGSVVSDYYTNPPTVATRNYAVAWRFDYNVGTLTYTDISTPSVITQIAAVPSASSALPSTAALYPVTLTNLPVLANTSSTNYDTTTIQLEIYRTIGNGQTYYKAGAVTNGTTTFSDDVTDTTLIANEELYTTGGVVGNDTPPQAKFIHILNNTAYYANIVEDGESLPARIRQSIQNDPDSCPATFYDDLDDDVTGLSSFRNYVVAFCKSSFYRLEGQFNELGQGAILHERISDTIGCVGHASIVRTEVGLFFAGTNGIYWTDGYTFVRVTRELEDTYNRLIATDAQKARISGTYDKLTRRVYWSMMSTSALTECDIAWVCDLNWGVKEDMSFTTWSGGTSFQPSCFAFYQGQIIRGDSRGYIFKHDAEYLTDPAVDVLTAATLWNVQPVEWDFQSCSTDFGTSEVKKWVTEVFVQGRNRSNLSLQISHNVDHGESGWRELVPVRSRKNIMWGDPSPLWGNTACEWAYLGMINENRKLPAGRLRATWTAIRFENASVNIVNSDTYSLADTGALVSQVGTATLQDTASLWPVGAAGNYSITFQADGYLEEYPILSRTATTITYRDTSGTSPASQTGVKWIIKGTPLGERFNLARYVVDYAFLSDQVGGFTGSTTATGANR